MASAFPGEQLFNEEALIFGWTAHNRDCARDCVARCGRLRSNGGHHCRRNAVIRISFLWDKGGDPVFLYKRIPDHTPLDQGATGEWDDLLVVFLYAPDAANLSCILFLSLGGSHFRNNCRSTNQALEHRPGRHVLE